MPGGFQTAIQLVFEGGVESPMLDTNHPSASTEISEVKLSGKNVESIICDAGCNSYIAKMQFKHENGQQVVFKGLDRHFGDTAKLVPSNHIIVGVYGNFTKGAYIRQLGFIVAEK